MDGVIGNRLRYIYWKKRLKYLGKGAVVDRGVLIVGAKYISIGDNTHIDKNVMLVAASPDLDISYRYIKSRVNSNYNGKIGEIRIGHNCHISHNVCIFGYYGVNIEDYCVLSADTKVYSLTSMAYNPNDMAEIVSIYPYSGKSPTLVGAVVIGRNAWIGIGCVVSPGVTLGENTFVKSMSIVNSSFGDNSYVGGIPAVKIRDRFQISEE